MSERLYDYVKITDLKDMLEKSGEQHGNRIAYKIKIDKEEQAYKLLNKVVEANIAVTKFEIEKPTLNDIFIEKVGE